MGLTAQDYLAELKALMPAGEAWALDEESNLVNLLSAMAEEFARLDKRSDDLRNEADPSTTMELLADWERVCGLPDNCSKTSGTLQQRRNAVITKLNAVGGSSRGYFKDLAESFGFNITITEYRAFKAGLGAVGDHLFNEEWVYYWQVNSQLSTITEFRVGQSAVGDPLRNWGNDDLECLLNKYKPAHTAIIFSYSTTPIDPEDPGGGEDPPMMDFSKPGNSMYIPLLFI